MSMDMKISTNELRKNAPVTPAKAGVHGSTRVIFQYLDNGTMDSGFRRNDSKLTRYPLRELSSCPP
jgi:hypothetical protein